MKKHIFAFVIFTLFCSALGYSQRGKNGFKNISSTGQVVNAYTALIADASAGATSISVTSNALSTNFSSGLAAGDLIFIIQMQGAGILSDTYYEGYGYIQTYNNCGKYEFAQVLSVSGSNTINLTCGLTQSYSVSGKTQVVRVPRFSGLNISSGAELTCDTWNGSTGGVLVVESQGNVFNSGTVNASGKGFRGGSPSPQYSNPALVLYDYASTDINYGGHKGEGIAAYGSPSIGPYCKGAPANGGGGGNSHNSGGGGGSNVSSNYDYNGCGFPDTTGSNYSTAWDFEPMPLLGWKGYPFHKTASYGGGRGGYTFSAINQDATMVGPGDPSWGGTYRSNIGGFGGWPLVENEGGYPRIYMGGGGGGGSANDTWGGAGGNGGGIIYFMSYGNISGSGSGVFQANGNPGGNSEGSDPGYVSSGVTGIDGSGGGGGGGAIILNAVNAIANISAYANGGKGGDQVKKVGWLNTSNQEAEGPGGGGGGGYIAMSGGTIPRTTYGGQNGISTIGGVTLAARNSMTEFPPNGATKGGPGISNGSVSNFTITTPSLSVCPGQPATLTATITGTVPSGTSYGWYDAEIGGSQLSNSTSLVISNPQATTTYYFGTCPGTYRVACTLNVYPFTPDAGNNVNICNGNTVQLQASWGGTGGTYSWTPSTGLDNPGISNPVCSAATTTTYLVTITNAGNTCSGTDSVKVTINPIPVVTVPSNIVVCKGSTVPASIFTSSVPGTTFSWTNSNTSIGLGSGGTGNILGFTANNSGSSPVTATITVSPSANNCSGNPASYTITVNPSPVMNNPSNQTVCAGNNVAETIFTSPTPGTTYTWTNSNTSIGLAATGNGNIPAFLAVNSGNVPVSATITVTPSVNGCNGLSTVYTITINPFPSISVPADTVVCHGSAIPAAIFTGSVAGTTFTWTNTNTNIGLASSGSGIIAGFNASNPGTTPISATITVTPVFNTCSGTPASYHITVNPQPTAVIPSNISVCSGGIVPESTFSGSVAGTVFSWTNSNTSIGIGTSGNGNIPAFLATNSGNVPVSATITVTPSANGCNGLSTVYTITINPLPSISIPADTVVCHGSAIPAAIFTGSVAGTTFTWTNTNTNIGLASSGSGIIAGFNASNPGTTPISATITVTPVFNTCSGTPASYHITVNPQPTAVIPSNINVCSGSIVPESTFSGPVAGTVFSWTNSNASIGIGTGGVGDIPSFTANNPGNAPVTATITVVPTANGCNGSSSAYSITVNPVPVVTAPGDISICKGADVAGVLFTSNVPGSGFIWTNSNTVIGLPAGGSGNIPVFTSDNPDTTAINAIITVVPQANNCSGQPESFMITVNPMPQIQFDSVLPTCPELNNGSLNAIVTVGYMPYLYTWNTGDSQAAISNLSNGIYSLTVTDTKGCSASRSIEFNVNVDCSDPIVYVPNIFSPNGDGNNDVFYVRGQEIEKMNIIIYDRWGEKIFESKDISVGWDGTYRGEEMPDGSYSYYLQISMIDGSKLKRKGTITLTR